MDWLGFSTWEEPVIRHSSPPEADPPAMEEPVPETVQFSAFHLELVVALLVGTGAIVLMCVLRKYRPSWWEKVLVSDTQVPGQLGANTGVTGAAGTNVGQGVAPPVVPPPIVPGASAQPTTGPIPPGAPGSTTDPPLPTYPDVQAGAGGMDAVTVTVAGGEKSTPPVQSSVPPPTANAGPGQPFAPDPSYHTVQPVPQEVGASMATAPKPEAQYMEPGKLGDVKIFWENLGVGDDENPLDLSSPEKLRRLAHGEAMMARLLVVAHLYDMQPPGKVKTTSRLMASVFYDAVGWWPTGILKIRSDYYIFQIEPTDPREMVQDRLQQVSCIGERQGSVLVSAPSIDEVRRYVALDCI